METITKLSASLIIQAVSSVTDISVEDIKSRCRKREFVDARRLAIYFIYDKCEYSLQRTANIFKMVNHTSVIYSNNSYFDLCDTDWKFKQKALKVKELLNIN